MLNKLRSIFLLIFAAIVIYSCDDTLFGDYNENQPPRTFLAVEEINLPDEERLTSNVEVEWWGDDPDGYVVGYEICIGDDCDPQDEESDQWEYTESTDTTLVLPIPEGEEIADVRFSVRAIDNEGLRDPEGAYVVFPIENSPPDIMYDPTVTPPDTTYSFFSFGVEASDPDGEQDLNYIEINVNDPDDGEWIEVDAETDFFTFDLNTDDVADDGTVSADFYTGRALNSTDEVLEGFNLDDDNTLYVRVFDQSLASSDIAEFDWYIKEQTSNILLINDVEGATQGDGEYHMDLLADIGFDNVDYWDISEALIPSGEVLPTPIDPTLNRVLAQWDHIYWLSDDLERNFLFAIETTLDFFDEGGTMFVNVPSRRVSSQNEENVFSLIPATDFEDYPPGQSRFTLTSGLIALNEDLDDLELDRGFTNIAPFIPDGDAEELYDGDFNQDGDYSRLLSAINNERDLLYMGINLIDFEEDEPVDETLEYFLDQLQFESD